MTGNISLAVAFAAGLVSFASPCCLPLVPAYVSYLVGGSTGDGRPVGSRVPRRTTLRQAVAFVLGFTVVFVALWASIGLIGYALRDQADMLRRVGGSVLVVMGLHVAGLISLPVLGRRTGPRAGMLLRRRPDGTVEPGTPGVGRSVLFGVVFAAGWTPCVGPILSGIIGLAALRSDVGQGAVLLVAYSLGLGLPFILVALGADAVRVRLAWLARHEAVVSVATGTLLVVVGFLMITNLLVSLSRFFPTFAV
ncbi:cytochrome c biogenesis protein CcdA [Intrasporangium sp.]|uniref:cytochrome c biogenesis CcdA family protein n=1 Tax=Intrasporangium sp. TaxID=1925024 RepID=UPI0032220058